MFEQNLFQHYNHLGFFNPFYFKENGAFTINEEFPKIIRKYEKSKTIDITSIIEILNRNFIFGDRTLVKGIYKSPWMAKPNNDLTTWDFFKLPDHDEQQIDEEEIAKTLFDKLVNEILAYIGDHKNIGILLSGGMDSRMVAGVLNYLIQTKTVSNLKVIGLTWGNTNSRDVVYAKRISKLLNWDWKHYQVTPKEFMDNINTAAINGAEYSAIHLHAMPQISEEQELDCILAGSFGDSVGRAEYSGVKVRNLKDLRANIKNFGKVLRVGHLARNLENIRDDLNNYHHQFPQKKQYQQFEQDYQLHYMRRMLNPCMAVINYKIPLYQAFSAPDVFGYMWSISPQKRTDRIYELMLDFFPSNLKDIPWARTGLQYGKIKGEPDQFAKRNHSYKEMIIGDAFGYINKLVLSDAIDRLNVFNMDSLKSLMKLIRIKPEKNFDYLEKLTWIASLALFVKKYDIVGDESNSNPLLNKVNGKIISSAEYSLKRIYRTITN